MSLWIKAVTANGLSMIRQTSVQRLPPIAFEQRRFDSYFTMGKKRTGKPKGIKPRPAPVREPVIAAKLYENEISQGVFEARAKDLPEENMENPFVHAKGLCILCKHNITPDYKNIKLLSQFISTQTGRVFGRHITGLCKEQQECVEREIRKARAAGLMAYYFKHPEFFKDPKLCDPSRPLRPHPY
ncbi:28S ribosomal protein S18c, mitochondrial [Frankliniella fusca]|uniref:28S ribosomal protein S18c, mitochondrial n=1 Tax=Frankliniella fusca TaxID=407009 RepID=A0AAE1HCQ0_9NEOP|nr:28S ribosomal protein S18c, mitochondrial [Frankliniella fusca]